MNPLRMCGYCRLFACPFSRRHTPLSPLTTPLVPRRLPFHVVTPLIPPSPRPLSHEGTFSSRAPGTCVGASAATKPGTPNRCLGPPGITHPLSFPVTPTLMRRPCHQRRTGDLARLETSRTLISRPTNTHAKIHDVVNTYLPTIPTQQVPWPAWTHPRHPVSRHTNTAASSSDATATCYGGATRPSAWVSWNSMNGC